MSSLVVYFIVLSIVFIVFLWLNSMAKKANKKSEQKRIYESKNDNVQELKKESTPNIYIPQKQGMKIEELYRELQNSVEITTDYFRRLSVVITPEEWSKDYGVISESENLVRLERTYFEELERRYQPTKEFNENLSKVCALNNKGIALEKDGNIDEAIATYEEGILIPYKARHSYDRLLVLYRKRKDYENEKRVCLAAIDRFPEDAKYKERLIKIEAKITKALKPKQE